MPVMDDDHPQGSGERPGRGALAQIGRRGRLGPSLLFAPGLLAPGRPATPATTVERVMRRLTPLALAGAALIVACQDTQVPTTPDVLAPSMDVSDGAHQPSEGPFSNPDFFFLPPLVHDPSTNPDFEPAEFNPQLAPVVRICEGTGDCPGAPVLEAPAPLVDGNYHLNWKTNKAHGGKTFRVRVLQGSFELGYVDVDLVKSGPRPAGDADNNARVNAGSTGPIKFSIENDALCFDPETGEIQETCSSATITTTEDSRVELPSEEDGLVAAV